MGTTTSADEHIDFFSFLYRKRKMCATIAIAIERSSALLRRWQDTRIEKLPRHSRRIPQGNRHTGKLISVGYE